MGQARPFASVEPHASFTLTSRLHHDNQVVALAPMLPTLDRFIFWKKFAFGRVAIAHHSPRDVPTVDGRWFLTPFAPSDIDGDHPFIEPARLKAGFTKISGYSDREALGRHCSSAQALPPNAATTRG
jgi:hypothetical protein